MTLEPGDLESLAEAVYRLADWGEGPALPSRLALRLFGPRAVRSVPNMMADGYLSQVNGRTIVAVRQSLPKPYAEHTIGHEMAHWICEREGCRCDSQAELEEACDYIGAAIHMRRSSFRARVRDVGFDTRQLALDFGTTETSAALRIGETESVSLAVVTPATVRARGPESWVWPEEQTIRAWARRGARGVRKVSLGERGRVALVADAETG